MRKPRFQDCQEARSNGREVPCNFQSPENHTRCRNQGCDRRVRILQTSPRNLAGRYHEFPVSFPWPVTDDELALDEALDIALRYFDLPQDEAQYATVESFASGAL